MKRKLVFGVVVFLIFGFVAINCNAQSSGNDQRIVGTWVYTHTDNTTLTLVFNANGTGTRAWSDGETVNFTYGISLTGTLGSTFSNFHNKTLFFSPDGRTMIFDDLTYRKR